MNTLLTLHDPAAARAYYDAGHWRGDTLYSLLAKHAGERPDAFALRDSRSRVTWRTLLAEVDLLSADLHRSGLRRGDRVAVWLPNRYESVVVMLACSRNAYVCNPSLHQNYTVSDVMALLDRTGCAALFAQENYGADAGRSDVFAAAQGLARMKRVYRFSSDRDVAAPLPSAGAGGAPASDQPPADANPDKVCYLAFTSGTTGAPKGVMHSDNTLLANARAMVDDWHHTPATILCSLSPLSHHIATVGVAQSLVAGFELVINDPPSGLKPLDWILHTGATYVMGVPTHGIDILAEARRRGSRDLGAVRIFYMAGAPIAPELCRGFLDLSISTLNVYGMTENGSHQYTLPDDPVDVVTGTCGRACAGYETRLWNAENPDVEAADGEIGEIGTRGALLTLGYFDNQSATESSFNAGGWFMSGDLGRLDASGNLQIVGRKKDLIIRGGHNIHPAHIENLAMKHPAVLKAAAFPIEDARLGERVCLAVIPRPEALIDAQAMLEHLDKAGLSRYDMPEYWMTLDAFPLTASGKVLKRELVEMTRAGSIVANAIRRNTAPAEA
jgi:acyl-CoA synthetase